MNTTIGVFENHEEAVTAVVQLQEDGCDTSNLSIVGIATTEEVNNRLQVTEKFPEKTAGVTVLVAVALCTTLGILNGLGLMSIPGLNMFFEAGALVGALAGFTFGLIVGALATLFTARSIRLAENQWNLLCRGKYLIVAENGNRATRPIADYANVDSDPILETGL